MGIIPLSNQLFPPSPLLHLAAQPHHLLLNHLLLPPCLLFPPCLLHSLPPLCLLHCSSLGLPLSLLPLPLSLPSGPVLPHLQRQSVAICVILSATCKQWQFPIPQHSHLLCKLRNLKTHFVYIPACVVLPWWQLGFSVSSLFVQHPAPVPPSFHSPTPLAPSGLVESCLQCCALPPQPGSCTNLRI